MRGSSLAALVICSSCVVEEPEPNEPLEPPDVDAVLVYESELVQAFVAPGLEFCLGDGARMDGHIERLSADLQVDPPAQLAVYVVGNNTGAQISNWCTGGDDPDVTGCFRPWIVLAEVRSIEHELNHAIWRTITPVSGGDFRFWEEAYASAWETSLTTPHLDPAQEYGHSAGHFIRWLVATHGVITVRDFFASVEPGWTRSQIDDEFSKMFGLDYDQMVNEFGAEADPMYPGYGWCDSVEVIEVPLGEVQASLRVDCGAADTFAFEYPAIEGMYVRRILRLEQRFDLEIVSSTETGVLNRHPCLEEPVTSEDDPRLDGDNWNWNIGSGVPAMGLDTTIENLEAGDHLFEFVVPMGEPVEVELSILATVPSG